MSDDIKKEFRELLADFYTPLEINTFMDKPHPQLGGKTPNVMIDNGAGKEVLQVIQRMNDCVYL